MICPICQKGRLLEPAPDMYQCPACGNGDTGRGFHYSWSLSGVDKISDLYAGITITYLPFNSCYSIGTISWEVDSQGNPMPHTVESVSVGEIDPAEYSELALPVVWFGKSGKLKNKMYKTTFGRKEKS